MDPGEVELFNICDQGFHRQEPDLGGNPSQMVDAEAVTGILHRHAHPDVRRPREVVGHLGETLGTLSEDLKGVLVGGLHRVEDSGDEIVGDLGVEEVGHGVDEDKTGLAPVERQLDQVFVAADTEARA
jgi:hypothetical protein